MNRQTVSKNITGLVVLAVGAALLLNALNVIRVDNIVHDYWPMAIVLAGLLVLLNSWRSWAIAAFLVVLGGLYQLREADMINVEPWAIVWPLILMFIGISIVFGRSYTGKRASKADRDDVTAIMAGADVKNHSKTFKQSDMTAIMGGAQIDLREADFDKDALVDVFAFWGGVEIIVPEHIVIRNQLNNIMAGTEDKTRQKTSKDAPVLTIAGTIIMSGVSIRNRPSSE